MNQIKIGKFIAECRREKDMTQAELAKKLGVTDKAISKWENGRCLMDISLLKPLSKVLEVSVMEIINGEKIKEEDKVNKYDETLEKTLKYSKNKIKKSKVKYIVGSVLSVLLIGVLSFLLYKGSLLFMYRERVAYEQNDSEFLEGIKITDKKTVYKKTISEDKYLVIDDMKIENKVSAYEKTEPTPGFIRYVKKDNDGTHSFSMGSTENYIDIFSSDDTLMIADYDFGQFSSADRRYFLLRNDINNDLDFLKYIGENGFKKSNLFTNEREIKENYAYKLFVRTVFPYCKDIVELTGDYQGFIFEIDKFKEAHIFRNGKTYIVQVSGELHNDDKFYELLSTLEIK